MIDLLSAEGLAHLQTFVTSRTLFAFDLDGTLAPIIADPAAVALPHRVQQAMLKLNNLATVAVITGRACDDARQRLGFEPRYLVGNHGLEGLPDNKINLQQEQQMQQLINNWNRQMKALLDTKLLQQLLVEQKSGSLSFHYRHATDPSTAHRDLLAAMALLEPTPRRVGGKFVENLLPQGAPHKGDALLHLMDHASATTAFFVGDDETDEDVFRLKNPQILSVCVGTNRPTAARYCLQKQTDMPSLIEQLVEVCQNQNQRETTLPDRAV